MHLWLSVSAQLEAVQRRLPHSLDSDVLMVNCTWEYMILWNKDPQVGRVTLIACHPL